MKPVSIVLFAALLIAATSSHASGRGLCPERGRCTALTVPPALRAVPALPALPAPPAPPAPPALPALPAPPAPPAPPLPYVPEAAHTACSSKAVGSKLTWINKRGLEITGTCQSDHKGMYLDVISIENET